MEDREIDHFETSKLTRSRFEELRACDKLPSPSNVALEVMEQLQRDNTCIADIAVVLQADPVLSGRLLELANSALFYPRTPVVTIQEAVTAVGLRNLRQLLLGISIISRHRSGGCKDFDYKLFWSQSVAIAAAAEVCCENRFRLAPAEAFTMGLLARIGQLAVATVYPEKYAGILRAAGAADTNALLAQEQDILSLEHLEVSCAMLEDWGLPVSVISALRGIYSLQNTCLQRNSREYELAKLFNYAYELSTYCISGPDGRPEIEDKLLAVAREYGYNEQRLGDQLRAVEDKWHEVSSVLKLPVSQTSGQGERKIDRQGSVETIQPRQNRGLGDEALRIMIAGGAQQEQDFLENNLVSAGHYVIAATDGRDALRKILESAPQVVIADIGMPEICGLTLAKMLRNNKLGREIYLILCDEKYSEPRAVRAWNAGADAYLGWPMQPEYLMAQIVVARRILDRHRELTEEIHTLNALSAELAQSNRKMEAQSLCDVLTGLPNRRYATNRLKQCVMEASRNTLPLSIMMLDLDHFKDVNDSHGHAVGDTVLQTVAEVFQRVCRGSDEVCRLGGEEFLVICRNTGVEDAMVAANRIREAVSELVLGEDKQFRITVSAGVSRLEEGETDIDNLLHLADVALYDAKRSGRNKVCRGNAISPVDSCVNS